MDRAKALLVIQRMHETHTVANETITAWYYFYAHQLPKMRPDRSDVDLIRTAALWMELTDRGGSPPFPYEYKPELSFPSINPAESVRAQPPIYAKGEAMSTIIDTILGVGQKLFGLRLELAKARQARKQTVSDFLAAIAQSIEEANALLKQGTYPHGKCQELLAHSQHMEAAIGDLIGQLQARELAAQLAEVYEIERLHAELGPDTDAERQRKLSVLDQAAGQFRATSAFVRVSP